MRRLRWLAMGWLLLVQTATAAVPQKLNYFETAEKKYQSVDLTLFEELQKIARSQKTYTAADFIPLGMSESNNQISVLSKIASQSLQTVLKSEQLRRSSLAVVAQSLSQEIKAVIPEENGGLRHEFSFLLRAASSQATFKYKGYLAGEVAYQFDTKSTTVEMNRQIVGSTQIVYAHLSNVIESRNTVSVRWNW